MWAKRSALRLGVRPRFTTEIQGRFAAGHEGPLERVEGGDDYLCEIGSGWAW